MLRLQLEQLGFAERLVDDAHARPEQHLASELAVEIAAEVAVGPKMIFWILGIWLMIFSALDELVTMMSLSAFTSPSS
jgi:hypothetical protein